MAKRFKRQNNRLRGKIIGEETRRLLDIIRNRPIKSSSKPKEQYSARKKNHFPLTDSDEITQVWEVDREGKCIKVVTVTYHLEYKGIWYDVVRFDSEHGFLDCHQRVSIQDETEIRTPLYWIIKKGTPQRWMNWAVKIILKDFIKYRRGFLKKSGIDEYY